MIVRILSIRTAFCVVRNGRSRNTAKRQQYEYLRITNCHLMKFFDELNIVEKNNQVGTKSIKLNFNKFFYNTNFLRYPLELRRVQEI